jgi:hypothetical protein
MTALVRDVAWVGNLIHPRGSKERLTLVLKAYLDGGGKYQDNNTPVVAVAGFVAGEFRWGQFEPRWQAFLDEFGLDNFHAAPFWSRKERPYSYWDDKKHALAADWLCSVFEEGCPFGVGWAVDKELFEQWRPSVGFFVDEDPYYFCLSLCLNDLIRGIPEATHDEGVAIYIDQDKDHEALGRQLARWHEQRLRRNPPKSNINRDRAITVTYGSRINFRPLQAADVLAHAGYQYLSNFLQVIGKPPPEPLFLPEPYFLERMNRARCPVHVNMVHTMKHFGIIAKRMAASSSGGRPL